MICPKCHFEWEEGEYTDEEDRREKAKDKFKDVPPMPTGNGGVC